MTLTRLVRASLLVAAAAFPIAATSSPAAAGGVHVRIGGHAGGHVHVGHWGVRGGGHWSGHVSWGYHPRHYHWAYRPRVRVGGSIWVGTYYNPYPYYYPTFASPPPAQPPCECGPSAYYPPVYPAPTTAVAAVAPAPELPRFGIGVFGGGSSTAGKADSNDVGLLGRLRLSRGLLFEGELGKSEMADSQRVDRRLEGALVWEIGADNAWAPYLLAGVGGTRADTADTTATQGFGEVGAGLRWALTPHFHITADIRAGSRGTVQDSGTQPVLARDIAPPPAGSGQTENYTRGRLAAILYF